ncbi:archaea-specific SMC-related protein [Methanosalsum natronophilum]|uniref:archaea-specific SMC-related protein n=1 Tax=Methanosalsum natronophilum TaxID=768733 RepID=UPI002168D993|nr:archaea-specific SMC-related protein [Methanosalsum natronophilum]MCS3924559.1 chromosome segregation ATPase [Methanosalsum natronophilum]
MDLKNFKIQVKNIGGIESHELDFKKGLNVIEAPNATGKTSFLRAFQVLMIRNGLVKDKNYFLKSGNKKGYVKIIDGDGIEYVKSLEYIDNRTLNFKGDNLFDENMGHLITRFAIGNNTNTLLTTIRNGGDIRNAIIEHTNLDELEAREHEYNVSLQKYRQEMKTLQSELKRKDELINQKGELNSQIKQVEKEIHLIEMSSKDDDVQDNESHQQYMDLKSSYTNLVQSIAKLKSSIENKEFQLKNLNQEVRNKENELENLKEFNPEKVMELKSQHSMLKSKLSENTEKIDTVNVYIDNLEKTLHSDHTIIDQYNEQMNEKLLETGLLGKSKKTCPTCGSRTDDENLKKHLQHLHSISSDLIETNNKIKNQIYQVQQELDDVESQQSKYNKYRSELNRTYLQVNELESDLVTEKEKLEQYQQDLTILKDKLDSVSKKHNDKKTGLNNNYIELKAKHGILKEKMDETESMLEALATKQDQLNNIKSKLNSLQDKKKEVVKEKEYLQSAVRTTFNENINHIKDIIGFENIKNVRLEVLNDKYNLVVVREEEKKPDRYSLQTLSTSELEVVGLIVMLSGYLAYKVNEKFPVLILDELTYLDVDRLTKLMDYLQQKVESIILTKLPEGNLNVSAHFQVLDSDV